MQSEAIFCEVRYKLDNQRMGVFADYARTWIQLIERHGGVHHGVFVPRDPPAGTPMSFEGKGCAGAGNEAIALFGFTSEEAYRRYRAYVATDPEGIAANERFADPPFESYERIFLRPIVREPAHEKPSAFDDNSLPLAPAGMFLRQYFHGTRADLKPGDLIKVGYGSNFREDLPLSWVYCAGTLDAAIWGAELCNGDARQRIYLVEPTGPIVDDPNVTDKKFSGNPTLSYRSRDPLRVVAEVKNWEGHSSEQIALMKSGLARLRADGGTIID